MPALAFPQPTIPPDYVSVRTTNGTILAARSLVDISIGVAEFAAQNGAHMPAPAAPAPAAPTRSGLTPAELARREKKRIATRKANMLAKQQQEAQQEAKAEDTRRSRRSHSKKPMVAGATA
jgi:hypothetical protein